MNRRAILTAAAAVFNSSAATLLHEAMLMRQELYDAPGQLETDEGQALSSAAATVLADTPATDSGSLAVKLWFLIDIMQDTLGIRDGDHGLSRTISSLRISADTLPADLAGLAWTAAANAENLATKWAADIDRSHRRGTAGAA